MSGLLLVSISQELQLTSRDADAIMCVLVAEQRKVSFCCLVYHLVSEVSRLCQSVFVTSDPGQHMRCFTCICFLCLC